MIPTEVTTTGTAYREVPISAIRPNPHQPRRRFDEEAMASLAASIKELGVLQPVLVRELGDGQFELIAGERRWRAAKRAGRQTIPVLVQQANDLQSLEQALVENLHRQDLNPIEEATAYQQLIDEFSYTHEQVAARVGKSRAAVTNTLRLLQLPAGVQRALAEGSLSAGHARALLGTPDRSLQEQLAQRVVAEGLTVRAVEELVRQSSASAVELAPTVEAQGPASAPAPRDEPAPQRAAEPVGLGAGTMPGRSGEPGRSAVRERLEQPLPDAGVLELEELLADYLETRVKVEMGTARGRIVIEFASLEDLERIYRRMVAGE
ncbi:ParB/RepB/Spo0J family partition protein [Aciditerrimonas ferrireducens]|uniref:ParB/RepB/Spo0J family partition protein n=1 Tax=Aciditerrimonas ferrireducens TaxID=667306 RepID=A0ABV6C0V5_9ACTN|nr:ParB/RepB/Spo0J family partition protein [Aciditerrimonas ferrireducens]MCK4176983.1 ParB/RepB/Spo0J family partition protein [Aciditerrimonas ferrireducens]